MSSTPIRFETDYVEPRSRLTTFFRGLLVIPHLIVAAVLSIGLFFAVIGAWFALLFTGRWPRGLYDFTARTVQYVTAVNGYFYLLTDRYPPFVTVPPDYPVRLTLGPPKDAYDRIKVLFRIILLIPVYIIAYVLGIVASIGVVLSWIVIVIIGKQPRGLQAMTELGIGYQQRAMAYYCLVGEEFPGFDPPPSSR